MRLWESEYKTQFLMSGSGGELAADLLISKPNKFMVYKLKITETAQKDLEKFDGELQRRFFKKIEKLKEYPDVYGKPLKHDLAGKWELRFEKRWRIVYIINQKENQVEIEAIWHKDDF